jgi:hypothetical protein
MVIMQLAKAVATKSVGEKASPLPWLSMGASIVILFPDCKCIASDLKFPMYSLFAVIIDLFFSKIIIKVFDRKVAKKKPQNFEAS